MKFLKNYMWGIKFLKPYSLGYRSGSDGTTPAGPTHWSGSAKPSRPRPPVDSPARARTQWPGPLVWLSETFASASAGRRPATPNLLAPPAFLKKGSDTLKDQVVDTRTGGCTHGEIDLSQICLQTCACICF